MAEPEEDALAEVVMLHDRPGEAPRAIPFEEATDDEKIRSETGALERRAVFEHRVAGSQVRAGMLPRALAAPAAMAVTNLMLAQLLQQEIVPTTAKEAAEVAKVAMGIYKEMSGNVSPEHLGPLERQQRDDTITAFEHTLRERAKAASAVEMGGAIPAGESVASAARVDSDTEEGDEWDHEVHDPDSE